MNGYSVYKHTSPSGKVYIGITRQSPKRRWKHGAGYTSTPHFYNAIVKYGWDNFSHEVLYQELSREDAGKIEKELIAKYRSSDPRYGYNVALGGEYGVKFTSETREKISKQAIKRYSIPENRVAASKAAVGKKHSEETKRKISQAHLGKPHYVSDETKQKMSESTIRSMEKMRREEPEKYSAQMQRFAELGRKNSRPVSQFSVEGLFIRTFNSEREAQRETGIRGRFHLEMGRINLQKRTPQNLLAEISWRSRRSNFYTVFDRIKTEQSFLFTSRAHNLAASLEVSN